MTFQTSQKVGKGLTIRKLIGGRRIFEPQEFFFIIKFLVLIFFIEFYKYSLLSNSLFTLIPGPWKKN